MGLQPSLPWALPLGPRNVLNFAAESYLTRKPLGLVSVSPVSVKQYAHRALVLTLCHETWSESHCLDPKDLRARSTCFPSFTVLVWSLFPARPSISGARFLGVKMGPSVRKTAVRA